MKALLKKRVAVFPYRKKCNSSCHGQALVEFALVLPIFLLVLIGMFDISRMVYTKHGIDKAAREGARIGIIEINGATGVAQAQATCTATLAAFQVTANSACAANLVNVGGQQAIQVVVTHNYQPFITNGGQFDIFPAIVLTSNSTMRKEG